MEVIGVGNLKKMEMRNKNIQHIYLASSNVWSTYIVNDNWQIKDFWLLDVGNVNFGASHCLGR